MSKEIRTQKLAAWIWSRALAAGLCIAILWIASPARAETQLGKPVEGYDSLPISRFGTKRSRDPDSSADHSFTKTGTALGVVVVGIAVALALGRKFVPGLAPDSAHRITQVLGQTPLGTKGTVYVLRCGPRVLIVGASAGQLTTLAEIADPDEIDEFIRLSGTKASRAKPSLPDSTNATVPARELRGQVDGMLDRLDSWKVSG